MKQLVLEKVGQLRDELYRLGLRSESSLLLLLLKFAGYEDEWKETVQELAASNPKPFNDWFNGESRLYLPFKEKDVVPDEKVKYALQDLGYEITDYIKGLAERDGRTQKIGKIINKKIKEVVSKVDRIIEEEKSFTSPDRIQALEDYKEQTTAYWRNILEIFRDSPVRTDKSARGRLVIVISQDPHDLAQMSYERSWTSCMRLGEGMYYRDLLCEVSGGGLVAYLIDQDDTEIKKPISRIHIRRFDSPDGRSVAMPESRAYGNHVEGFKEAVKQWTDSMNEHLPAGVYRRKGGRYSDSYSHIYPQLPEEAQEKLDWITENRPEYKEDIIVLRDNYYGRLGSIDNYWKDFHYWSEDDNGDKIFTSEEELQKFIQLINDYDPEERWLDVLERNRYERGDKLTEQEKDELRRDRFTIERKTKDHKEIFRRKIVEDLIQLDSENEGSIFTEKQQKDMEAALNDVWPESWAYEKEMFYTKYPHLMTPEVFKGYGHHQRRRILRGTWLSKEQKDKLTESLLEELMQKMDLDSKYFKMSESQEKMLEKYPADKIYFYRDKLVELMNSVSTYFHHDSAVKLMGGLSKALFDSAEKRFAGLEGGKESIETIFKRYMGLLADINNPFSFGREQYPEELMNFANDEYIRVISSPYFDWGAWPEDTSLNIHNYGKRMLDLDPDKKRTLLPLLKERLVRAAKEARAPKKGGWMSDPSSRAGWTRETPEHRTKAIKANKRRLKYLIKTIETGAGASEDWDISDLGWYTW